MPPSAGPGAANTEGVHLLTPFLIHSTMCQTPGHHGDMAVAYADWVPTPVTCGVGSGWKIWEQTPCACCQDAGAARLPVRTTPSILEALRVGGVLSAGGCPHSGDCPQAWWAGGSAVVQSCLVGGRIQKPKASTLECSPGRPQVSFLGAADDPCALALA